MYVLLCADPLAPRDPDPEYARRPRRAPPVSRLG